MVPEHMDPDMVREIEETARVEELQEILVEDVEREMQAIHLECEPEEEVQEAEQEEDEMIEEHLSQNGEEEEFIDSELSNDTLYVEQIETTPGFPTATLNLDIECKEEFSPPKRIPMPTIPVTPDLTAGPLLIPHMTDQETMAAIQTITLTVNNAVELNAGPIEFNLDSMEQPIEFSEE